MSDSAAQAKTLLQTSRFIKIFQEQIVVIKYGGSVMENQAAKTAFCRQVAELQQAGIHPVIVHGGGKEISAWLKKVGIEPKFLNGLRVTDAATMEVAEMVLCGKTRNDLVCNINKLGGKALGLCGKDANLFDSEILSTGAESLGLVGKVTRVDTKLLRSIIASGCIPVISPIGMTADGQTVNINADEAAGKIAGELKAAKFILLTDVDGILKDQQLIKKLSLQEAQDLLKDPAITGGMIPKLNCCLQAIKAGVQKVHIISGIKENSLILELLTEEGSGTMIES